MSDSTGLIETIDSSQAAHEVTANALFAAGSTSTAYGRHAEACAGLTWGYYGTRFGGAAIANGTNLCTASTTTYMVAHLTTGAVSFATTITNWNDTEVYGRCYKIIPGPTTIPDWEDHRLGPGGVFAASGLATTDGTVTSVDITPPAAGITATGGPVTAAGSITLALANDLAAVEGLAATGIVRRTAADTWTAGTAVSLTSEVTGILPVANFTTGAPDGSKFVRDDGVLAVPAAAASVELKGLTFTSETATTTDADPGAGKFKWNHATQASATVLYFDDATADSAALSAYWASLGTTGFIYMQQADDSTKWQLWRWTAATVDGTGYRKFTVALQAAVGSIATAKTVLCAFNSAPIAGDASRIGLAFEKEIALSDLTTAITTGTTKGYWRPAFAATGVSARLSLRVASSSGIPTVDMNKATVSMMSTKLTIDASELTSLTAANAVVMSSTTLSADDLIEFDIDVAGTGAMGLIVTVTGLYA